MQLWFACVQISKDFKGECKHQHFLSKLCLASRQWPSSTSLSNWRQQRLPMEGFVHLFNLPPYQLQTNSTRWLVLTFHNAWSVAGDLHLDPWGRGWTGGVRCSPDRPTGLLYIHFSSNFFLVGWLATMCAATQQSQMTILGLIYIYPFWFCNDLFSFYVRLWGQGLILRRCSSPRCCSPVWYEHNNMDFPPSPDQPPCKSLDRRCGGFSEEK